MAINPYEGLPKRQFWRPAVAEDHVLSTTTLYRKKFPIKREDRIGTAGSCFAQHISKRLISSGFNYLDVEPPPAMLPNELHSKFGYGIFSARYGNIYTVSQLLQLAQEAVGIIPIYKISWEKNGRFYDPLRPNVEPYGLSSPEEVIFHRQYHLRKVRLLLESCDVFIFTLGLTEGWICKRTGRTLPNTPGTIAGVYDPELYEFHNFTHKQIKSDFVSFMNLVWEIQKSKKCRFILTISPVPLTATATDNHVLVATTYSKATLRSVAGELYNEYEEVDYFPAFEIIFSPWSRGIFYETNLRTVSKVGVDAVMRIFFLEHHLENISASHTKPIELSCSVPSEIDDDVVCEEALLEAFAK